MIVPYEVACCGRSWHAACDTGAVALSPRKESSIGADTLESFARVAAALSLLASYKIGRGGWPRSRQRVARAVAAVPLRPGASRGQGASPDPEPPRVAKPRRFRLHSIVAGLWIALSLVLVAYATIRGELALAQLDGFDLVAPYSLSPPAPLFDESP
jgi:hypothetical protein